MCRNSSTANFKDGYVRVFLKKKKICPKYQLSKASCIEIWVAFSSFSDYIIQLSCISTLTLTKEDSADCNKQAMLFDS